MPPEPRKPEDAEPLTSSIESLCYLAAKAREFDVKVEPSVPDEASNPTDDSEREVLELLPTDAVEEEIRAALGSMDVDELAEVIALVWLGRGDFDRSQWPEALAQARDRMNDDTAGYLLGIPLLGDFLEGGLSQLGYSCQDYQIDRL